METKHIWQFSRVGGVNRVNLETGNDLLSLTELDQKLWTALSCPVHGLEIDPKTLELIDTDCDGKIRVPEVLEAVKWITSRIKNPNELTLRSNTLPLSSIKDDDQLGKQLLASAKQILVNLEKTDSTSISVDETSDTIAIFAKTKFNGDGIITEESTDNPDLKSIINSIMACVGSEQDRSGKYGINSKHVEDFFNSSKEYLEWYLKSEKDNSSILPYGENTDEAYSLFNSLRSKIDDYFIRCQMAEFDPESTKALNSLAARMEVISYKDLPTCFDEIAGFPIAKIETKKPLLVNSAINPAWREKLIRFIAIIYNDQKKEIGEDDWKQIQDSFSLYAIWKNEKKGEAVERLGVSTIQKILADNHKDAIVSLIEKDKALEAEANSIILVDKLVRYYRDIYTLLNNFVTFADFYSPSFNAIFQSGSLFFDQRSCDLCIKVSDMSKHSSMAGSSGICLVYCDCYSKAKNEKMTIVAALTDGDVDNISVGRNAVFYDRKGLDWDATIVKIIDNPISIRQAFWSPYRKTAKFISKQVDKFASSKDQEVQSTATAGVEKVTSKIDEGISQSTKSGQRVVSQEQARPAPFDIAKFAGIFAAIGMAIGAIGTVLASIIAGILSLSWWKMPIALAGLILAISGPSMLIAWLKLRKRNLAPVLDANGWAINAKATINIAFGNTLTHLATLPKNSKQNFRDPFAKKRNPWIPIIIILIILVCLFSYLWYYGYLERWGVI